MNLTTPVDIAPSPLRIDHNTPLLLMGSCFSDEIGGRLQRAGFEVLCNPFGTLYNPLSIAIALHHALDDREIDTDWLIHRDGLWLLACRPRHMPCPMQPKHTPGA